VLTEVLAATVDGAPVRDLDRFCDGPADTYSKSFSSHFDALAGAWTSIDELRGITAFSALCRGLARTEPAPRLDYWMHEYEVPVVPTTTEADVLGNTSAELGVEVYGGVCLEALSLRLKDGDLTAFSNAIIESRPSADALTWSVAVSPDNEIRALGLGDGAAMYSVVEAYSRGDHLFRAKDYDHAIACWLEVARQCPESGEVFWRIGRAFERKGMVACAADYYTKALEQDPFLNCPAVLIVEEK
ncbi:MAG TPA: tetratricopeptide repeat protein, partial [Candidatus Hydrogenedentes bacterium]|nr:tetratricopeptide repeat protein [Candidatus Hydrogenedentota bacterium]